MVWGDCRETITSLTSERQSWGSNSFLPSMAPCTLKSNYILKRLKRLVTASLSRSSNFGSLLTLSISPFTLLYLLLSKSFDFLSSNSFPFKLHVTFHLDSFRSNAERRSGVLANIAAAATKADRAVRAVSRSKVGSGLVGEASRINLFSEVIIRVLSYRLSRNGSEEPTISTQDADFDQQNFHNIKKENTAGKTFSCLRATISISPNSTSAYYLTRRPSRFTSPLAGAPTQNHGNTPILISNPTRSTSTMDSPRTKEQKSLTDKGVLFSPPSFQKFSSTMSTPANAPSPPGRAADVDKEPSTPEASKTEPIHDRPNPEDPEQTERNSPPQINQHVRSDAACTAGSENTKSEHTCTHQKDRVLDTYVSRHDARTASPDLPSDGLPISEEEAEVIQDLEKNNDLDESGTVRDPENEGDRELLRRRASGTSNLTGDIDLLRSSSSTPEQNNDDNETVPDQISTQDSSRRNQANTEAADDVAKSKIVEDDDETERTRLEKEREERCLREHDEFYKLEDERLAKLEDKSSNSSVVYDQDTEDEGGRAGLDPDHSAMWVPHFIDTEANMSKSKRRRKRQKARQERIRNNDNLGRLLGGRQTKEDEDRISTYDYENERNKERHSLNTSGVQGGNLLQKKRKAVPECEDDEDFRATLNSTKYGADFDQDDPDMEDHSFLREGSDSEELRPDITEPEDVEDIEASNEGADEDVEHEDDKKETNSSNNSTGAKKRRLRKKRTAQQLKSDPPPLTHEVTGRETRSKASGKSGLHGDEASKNKTKVDESIKGEKEKNPQLKQLQLVSDHGGQVAVFKKPTCSRSDLRRLVAKAVHKSKNKLSNNFALNTKIQHFNIVTDSSLIKKMPVIDDNAPLIEMAIPEFIWPSQDKTIEDDNMINVKSRGSIQFIILVRSCHAANPDSWDTPSIEKVRDFASYLTCQIADLKLDFGAVLRWTNPWGNVAVMGLDSSDLDLLLRFRTFLSTLRYIHQFFNTFLKDAMTDNLGISILLRSDLQVFQEKHLAEALFARNDLSGILETLQAETFTASDKTRAGVSKSGWRNVLMEGDDEFLKSLSKFTALHWFNIGPASVQIHGGDRRAETPEEIEAKNKRKRFSMPVGHSLTDSAKASINKSFRADQEALARNLVVPNPAQSVPSGANKAPIGKKKK